MGRSAERGDGCTANRQRLFRIEREAGRDVEHRGPARRIEQRARNAQARDADVRVGIRRIASIGVTAAASRQPSSARSAAIRVCGGLAASSSGRI